MIFVVKFINLHNYIRIDISLFEQNCVNSIHFFYCTYTDANDLKF